MRKKLKIKIIFLHPQSHWRRESDPELDPEPDPFVRGTDPGIRIRTKMSRISNTARNVFLFSFLYCFKKRHLQCRSFNLWQQSARKRLFHWDCRVWDVRFFGEEERVLGRVADPDLQWSVFLFFLVAWFGLVFRILIRIQVAVILKQMSVTSLNWVII